MPKIAAVRAVSTVHSTTSSSLGSMLMAQSPMARLSSPRIRIKQELTDRMPGLHLMSCSAGRTVSAVE